MFFYFKLFLNFETATSFSKVNNLISLSTRLSFKFVFSMYCNKRYSKNGTPKIIANSVDRLTKFMSIGIDNTFFTSYKIMHDNKVNKLIKNIKNKVVLSMIVN